MAKKVTTKKTTTKKKATTRKRTTAKKTATTVAAATAPTVTPTRPTFTDVQIRIRAFEIYCAGQNPSNPDADWHQAERELEAEIAS